MIRAAASLCSRTLRPTAGATAARILEARERFEVSSLAYLVRHLAADWFGGRPAAGIAVVGRRCTMGA